MSVTDNEITMAVLIVRAALSPFQDECLLSPRGRGLIYEAVRGNCAAAEACSPSQGVAARAIEAVLRTFTLRVRADILAIVDRQDRAGMPIL